MPRSLLMAAILAAVPFAMAPNVITLQNAIGNPNGMPEALKEDGTFQVAQGFKLIIIIAVAKNATTGQESINAATIDPMNGTWNHTLNVVPGTYNCKAIMVVEDQNGKKTSLESNEIKGVKVK